MCICLHNLHISTLMSHFTMLCSAEPGKSWRDPPFVIRWERESNVAVFFDVLLIYSRTGLNLCWGRKRHKCSGRASVFCNWLSLPSTGFTPSPTLTFLHDDSSHFLKAKTCSNRLQLPVVHSSYESFAADMMLPINILAGRMGWICMKVCIINWQWFHTVVKLP